MLKHIFSSLFLEVQPILNYFVLLTLCQNRILQNKKTWKKQQNIHTIIFLL